MTQGATVAAKAVVDQLAAPTEIGHLEDRHLPEVAAYEQVCRLDVPMHDAMVVHVREPIQEVPHQVACGALFKNTALPTPLGFQGLIAMLEQDGIGFYNTGQSSQYVWMWMPVEVCCYLQLSGCVFLGVCAMHLLASGKLPSGPVHHESHLAKSSFAKDLFFTVRPPCMLPVFLGHGSAHVRKLGWPVGQQACGHGRLLEVCWC
jgi:hypothetical protein